MNDEDVIDHPKHYTSHPSGIECIQVVEHFGFSIGNAIKYLWRAGLKGDALEDLKKARWYVDREIARLEGQEPRRAYTLEFRCDGVKFAHDPPKKGARR